MTPQELRRALTEFQRLHGLRPRRARDLYAARQLLVRLQRSRYADRFVLKGGLFVGAVLGDFLRTTRDVDTLGEGHADPDGVRKVFEEVANVQLDDGVRWGRIQTRLATREGDGYDGVKLTLEANVAGLAALATMDIGYGDAVVPEPIQIVVPALFASGDPLRMPAYPVEAFLAEKAETIVSGFPGRLLRRLKDFYDISMVTARWERPLDGRILVESFHATFSRRRTKPVSGVFADIKFALEEDSTRARREWDDFKSRTGARVDEGLMSAVEGTRVFATPILDAIATSVELASEWRAGQGWVDRKKIDDPGR